MSQEKTLDNTQAIMKELEKGQHHGHDTTKSDNTTTKSASAAPTNKKSKSKKASSGTDSSGTSSSSSSTSLENIQSVLSDPAIKKDFLGNVVDLLGGYQRRKLTDKEVKSLENIIEDGLLSKVFHVKKTII